MATSGFSFGAPAPTAQQPLQQQQQQQPAPGTLFGAAPGANTLGLGGKPATTTISLFGTNTTTTSSSGLGFGTATSQSQQPQTTGFSLGLGTAATSAAPVPTGFSFGTASAAPAQLGAPLASTIPSLTQPQQPQAQPGPTGVGSGLGGVPSVPSARISTLALGGDPRTGWATRDDNRAVQDHPVPPEILALVEDLKNAMKNHKTTMMDITRSTDIDIDSVAEQIDEVRMGVNTLTNVIHKQELQTASLIKDMQELGKDMDLLAQIRDVPAYGYGGSSNLVLNYLYNLVNKYSQRMTRYKVEIERAEFSLQTLVEAYNLNAKDLWASLTAIKDTVILLAAQVQQLHEDLRNELTVHKNYSRFLLGTKPKPWLTNALSGNAAPQQSIPPLERIMSNPKGVSSSGSIESMYSRTYNMLGRVPSVLDSRGVLQAPSSDSMLRTPAHDLRGSTYSPSYHPSAMGSYLGPSSPVNVGLKRSKQ